MPSFCDHPQAPLPFSRPLRQIVWIGAGMLILAASLLQACSLVQRSDDRKPLAGAVGRTNGTLLAANGSRVSLPTILQETPDYLLIGESHDNACDHRVQATVLQQAAARGHQLSLGLEMVPKSRQATLDRFNNGTLSLKELETELDWKTIWGHSFSLYAVLFQAAREHNIDVYGLNLDRQLVEAVQQAGLSGLMPEERQRLPDRIIPPPEAQRAYLKKQLKRHKSLLQDKAKSTLSRERFFLIQSLWDSTMAAEAARIRQKTGNQLVIATGSGHVENDWGIAHRLKRLDPDAAIVSLMPWRGLEALQPDAADYFFYCPVTGTSRFGFRFTLTRNGLLIHSVQPGSRAEQAGLRPSDRILRAGGNDLKAIFDLHSAAIRANKKAVPLSLTVDRKGEQLQLLLPMNGTETSNSGHSSEESSGKQPAEH